LQYRAIIKKSEGWWIGWLVDLPGVNAQEKTKAELMKSLKIGAQEMLATEITFESEAIMTTINVPDPEWIVEAGA
jgi:predicted RNase H-like HicB family nuclease